MRLAAPSPGFTKSPNFEATFVIVWDVRKTVRSLRGALGCKAAPRETRPHLRPLSEGRGIQSPRGLANYTTGSASSTPRSRGKGPVTAVGKVLRSLNEL
jgi:hypothetical protein